MRRHTKPPLVCARVTLAEGLDGRDKHSQTHGNGRRWECCGWQTGGREQNVREAMDWGWTGDGALTSAGACIQLFVVAGVDGGAAATILVSNLVQSVWRAQHAGSPQAAPVRGIWWRPELSGHERCPRCTGGERMHKVYQARTSACVRANSSSRCPPR